MRQIILGFFFLISINQAFSQDRDTVVAMVINIQDLKVCNLIQIVLSQMTQDTITIVSPNENPKTRGSRQLNINESYTFVIDKPINVASLKRGQFHIEHNGVTLWTNAEPYSRQPRYCRNCAGNYINY